MLLASLRVNFSIVLLVFVNCIEHKMCCKCFDVCLSSFFFFFRVKTVDYCGVVICGSDDGDGGGSVTKRWRWWCDLRGSWGGSAN